MASGHAYRVNRPNTWLSDQCCKVKILLANPEPSTHGPSHQFGRRSNSVAFGSKRTLSKTLLQNRIYEYAP